MILRWPSGRGMKWGLRCSDLCKTSCRVVFLRHESPLLFSMQTPMLWLPGMVLLGCCHGWKRLGRGSALLKKSWGRIEWLAKAKWARYECRSSRTRAECLKKSVLKCITPLNVSYRSRTRLCARASRERIRLDSRSVQVLKILHILMTDNHINIRLKHPSGRISVSRHRH